MSETKYSTALTKTYTRLSEEYLPRVRNLIFNDEGAKSVLINAMLEFHKEMRKIERELEKETIFK